MTSFEEGSVYCNIMGIPLLYTVLFVHDIYSGTAKHYRADHIEWLSLADQR